MPAREIFRSGVKVGSFGKEKLLLALNAGGMCRELSNLQTESTIYLHRYFGPVFILNST